MAVSRALGWDSQTQYKTAMSVKNETDEGIFRIREGQCEWETQQQWYKTREQAA